MERSGHQRTRSFSSRFKWENVINITFYTEDTASYYYIWYGKEMSAAIGCTEIPFFCFKMIFFLLLNTLFCYGIKKGHSALLRLTVGYTKVRFQVNFISFLKWKSFDSTDSCQEFLQGLISCDYRHICKQENGFRLILLMSSASSWIGVPVDWSIFPVNHSYLVPIHIYHSEWHLLKISSFILLPCCPKLGLNCQDTNTTQMVLSSSLLPIYVYPSWVCLYKHKAWHRFGYLDTSLWAVKHLSLSRCPS